MKITQCYALTNASAKEVLGETAVVAEDLSNIVDLGRAILDNGYADRYVRSLTDHIGRVVFVNRAYAGRVPSVLMDAWEWGAVTQKISGELPEAEENEAWELVDGASYDPNIVTLPKIEQKFYSDAVTFMVPVTITEDQVKSAFSSREQYNGFVSMIYGLVEKAMTLRISNLIMKTINNMTAETLNAGGIRAVNLLTAYNTEKGTTLTAEKAIHDTDFIKYASFMVKLYASRMGDISSLFNVNGKARFTPKEKLHIVMLQEFKASADVYLQSDTFHNELTALPMAEEVNFWQGSGTSYAFADTSKINVKTSAGHEVTQGGILCVLFDGDALGVRTPDKSVRSQYNAKGNFTNNYFSWKSSYFNDLSENFIVFYVA